MMNVFGGIKWHYVRLKLKAIVKMDYFHQDKQGKW